MLTEALLKAQAGRPHQAGPFLDFGPELDREFLRPNSATEGTSGSDGARLPLATASVRSFPARTNAAMLELPEIESRRPTSGGT